MIDPKEVEDQLQKVLRECASLREENERLKKLLGLYPEDSTTIAVSWFSGKWSNADFS
jgi:cell shape-determining protein MreC